VGNVICRRTFPFFIKCAGDVKGHHVKRQKSQLTRDSVCVLPPPGEEPLWASQGSLLFPLVPSGAGPHHGMSWLCRQVPRRKGAGEDSLQLPLQLSSLQVMGRRLSTAMICISGHLPQCHKAVLTMWCPIHLPFFLRGECTGNITSFLLSPSGDTCSCYWGHGTHCWALCQLLL